MTNVVRLPRRRTREQTFRACAFGSMSEAIGAIENPKAVVVVAVSDTGYAIRTASFTDEIRDFDMYARAEAIIAAQKMRLVE